MKKLALLIAMVILLTMVGCATTQITKEPVDDAREAVVTEKERVGTNSVHHIVVLKYSDGSLEELTVSTDEFLSINIGDTVYANQHRASEASIFAIWLIVSILVLIGMALGFADI